MSKEHQEEHFTEFQGHTLLKHGVLDRYVKAWIQILKGVHEKLWIVDGFAGRGKDDVGNPGSPLLLARSAAQLREKGAEVQLFAVELRRDNYDTLVKNLAEFDIDRGGQFPIAYLRQGTLADHLEEAFRLIGDAPAFVFLDPFGAGGLSLSIMERTLALPKGEVFALFSYRAIHRHLSVLATDYSERARREAAKQPGLFPDLDEELLAQQLERAQKSDATLLPTKGAAQRILVELFGSLDDIRRILRPSTRAGFQLPQRTASDYLMLFALPRLLLLFAGVSMGGRCAGPTARIARAASKGMRLPRRPCSTIR